MFEKFLNLFKRKPEYFVKSFGRFEIIGNHTDHNGGLCIASACNLAISGMLSLRNDNVINVVSEGYSKVSLSLDDLTVVKEEEFSSKSLIKGITKFLIEQNYNVGGFDLYTRSSIFKGAGVSSSAAFELLIGQIFNELFNENKIPSDVLAKAGQFAENSYFGKKCGLLDQTSIAFSKVSFMDFENDIKLETLDWKFNDISIFLVNTGGSHADLSDLYSNIPAKMKSAAIKMGKERLIDCKQIDLDKFDLDEEEKRFATHFFEENIRVKLAKEAIKSSDKTLFYKVVNESRKSSTELLKNMQVANQYAGSPLEACDIAYSVFKEKGACKINGGGFAGSILCFVDSDISDQFRYKLYEKYGVENVVGIRINNEKPYVKKIQGLQKIMFQGDSVTDAGRDRSDVHNLAGYSLCLANKLNYKYEFVNYACSGDTSRKMVKRHFKEFKKEMPDFLVFLIGINDIWRFFAENDSYKDRVYLSEYIKNVTKTVKKSLKINKNSKIVVLEPYLLSGISNLKERANDMYNSYMSALSEVLASLPVTFIKTNALMNKEQDSGNLLSFDGVHPNDNGNEFLANLLKEYFDKQ